MKRPNAEPNSPHGSEGTQRGGRRTRSSGVLATILSLPARLAAGRSSKIRSKTAAKKAKTRTAKKKLPTRKPARKPKAKRATQKKTAKRKPTPTKAKRAKKAAKPAKPRKKSAAKVTARKATARKTRAKPVTPKKRKAKSATAKKATKRAARKPSAAKRKRAKKPVAAKKKPTKRRRARPYSILSRYSTFQRGDTVIFERVRDWNLQTEFIEMRGTVISKGRNPDSGLNYIEVEFEVETPGGGTIKQVRRFTVK